ncbi:MAG: peptidoglycan-binding protein [Alphaproteobacteria bacterium]|jgi:peptidoglycan hydrolase-like protein with peptidoglycan-binding domain|nr:peptidoglycan-binding protein [Alphaproteobacteria bacterium]
MSIFGAIGDVLEDVAGGIGHAVGGIGDALEDVAGSIGKAAKGAAGFLGRAVGDGLDNLADDVKKVQNSLKKLGHFDEEPNGILSKSLDAAIRGFQRESGLKVDGKLLPGGETEREIYKKRTGRDPNAIWAPADDGREIGFGQAYTNFRDRGLLGTLGAIGSAITDGVDSLTDGDPETNPWSTQKKTGREWEEATTAQSIAKYKAEKAAEAAPPPQRERRDDPWDLSAYNLDLGAIAAAVPGPVAEGIGFGLDKLNDMFDRQGGKTGAAPKSQISEEESLKSLKEVKKKGFAKAQEKPDVYEEISGFWEKERAEEEAFRREQEEFIRAHPPVINDSQSRISALLSDAPAVFEIVPDPGFNDQSARERAIDFYVRDDNVARRILQENNTIINRMATRHGVESDLIRAVMWTENARGDKFGLNRLADTLGVSGSQGPMNINGNMWGALIPGRMPGRLDDPEENIEAATILLGRIRDRIKDPTPAKIGSIWNFSGREYTNGVGEAIGRAYQEKPWKNPQEIKQK